MADAEGRNCQMAESRRLAEMIRKLGMGFGNQNSHTLKEKLPLSFRIKDLGPDFLPIGEKTRILGGILEKIGRGCDGVFA